MFLRLRSHLRSDVFHVVHLFWLHVVAAIGSSRSVSSCLRVRPVFPAAIGFSWPSRSPYAGWLIFGVFLSRAFLCCDVSFRSFSVSSHMCCHAPFFSVFFDSTCAFLRHCLAGIFLFSRLSFVARGFRAAARISLFRGSVAMLAWRGAFGPCSSPYLSLRA